MCCVLVDSNSSNHNLQNGHVRVQRSRTQLTQYCDCFIHIESQLPTCTNTLVNLLFTYSTMWSIRHLVFCSTVISDRKQIKNVTDRPKTRAECPKFGEWSFTLEIVHTKLYVLDWKNYNHFISALKTPGLSFSSVHSSIFYKVLSLIMSLLVDLRSDPNVPNLLHARLYLKFYIPNYMCGVGKSINTHFISVRKTPNL